MTKHLLIVIVLSTVLISCTANPVLPKPGTDEVRLYGKVTDMNESPLPNCYVQVSDENNSILKAIRTNKNGEYDIVVPVHTTYQTWVGAYSNLNQQMFSYIPQTKILSPGKASELRADFSLRPGGNIIIQAYDKTGKLLRNKDFRDTTDSQVFVTALNNEVCYSNFCAINDESSNWEWNHAIPAIVVSLKIPHRIHVLWEIPEFGKIILLLDNEGRGYQIDKQGNAININLNYEAAKSKFAALLKDYDLIKKQSYKISDSVEVNIKLGREHLSLAQGYLDRPLLPDMNRAIQELNLSLKYTSVAYEQLYLDRARADINKYRKGKATLVIQNSDNKNLSNCTIQMNQVSSDFHFSANPLGENGGYNQRYVELLKTMGINYAHIVPRWGRIEPNEGVFDWGNIESYQNIGSYSDDKLGLIGSLSMWFYRGGQVGYDFCPLYQDAMTFEKLKENVFNHMYTLAARYKGKIDIWEINEINLPYANALNLSLEQKLQICDVFAKAVKKANAEAKILISSIASPYEYNLSQVDDIEGKQSYVSFPDFINLLIQRQTPLDIIGLEFYNGGVNTNGDLSVCLSMVAVSDIFDQYTYLGKPIVVSEFSVPSTQVQGSAWWHRPWDEQTQAEYSEKFYTIAFSKPLVQGIAWSWGVADKDAFIISGGLLDASLRPKQSYFALEKLINSWHTPESTIKNVKGENEFIGFAGDYNVTIKAANGYNLKTKVHISEQKTERVIIKLTN